VRTFKPGDRFFHYTVGRLLGEGFHGEVYEITHTHTGARFALKTMHLKNVGDARMVCRALSEARGTYGIDHANVIKVHDLNCEQGGLVWMRTELLEGETIAELLGRLGRFSPLFALSVAIEAAHGLHAAHEAQIIHRDVKPANLFYVSATRTVKVIDFSIAKVFPEGLQTTMGRAGMGTPAFMPPEQLEGAVPNPAFDIYALGISLWQMLAGRHPFHDVLHQPSELLRKHFSEMPPLLSDVADLPAEVDRVVRRAVAKDPAERYRTMHEMAQAVAELRAWLEHEADAGRISLDAVPGEPAKPGDGRSRRDYTPPTSMPRPELPAPETARRVVLAAHVTPATAVRAPRALGGTLPLGGRTDLAGTVPLADPAATGPNNRAAIPAASPPRPLAATASSPATTAAQARSPETPTSVTSPLPVRLPSRVPWRAVAIAVALAALVAVPLVVWGRARRVPETIAPAGMPSATAPVAAPTQVERPSEPTVPPTATAREMPLLPVSATTATATGAAHTGAAARPPRHSTAPTALPAPPPPAPAPAQAPVPERPRASSRPFDVEN
jgi:serine/threonine-protein kinase